MALSASKIARLVEAYKANPDNFSGEEIQQIQQLAKIAGIPMNVKTDIGRLIGNALFQGADSALFGILPNDWGPTAVTPAEKIAGGLGSLAGLFGGPAYLGDKLASEGIKGLEALAGAKDLKYGEGAIGSFLSNKEVAGRFLELVNKAKKNKKLRSILKGILKDKQRTSRALQVGGALGTRDFFEQGLSPIDAIAGTAAGYYVPAVYNKYMPSK